MQPFLKLVTLTDHVQLNFSVSPIGPVAEITRSYDCHLCFVAIALIEPRTFSVVSPITIRVLMDIYVRVFLKHFQSIYPI